MPHNTWRIKTVCALVCMLAVLLMGTAALAQANPGYHTFEKYRLQMPAGIVLASERYDPRTGWLYLVVDSEKSDFGLALTNGYEASIGNLLFRGEMIADTALASKPHESLNFSPADETRIQEFTSNFRAHESNFGRGEGDVAYWTWYMGSYNEQKGLFFPEKNTFGNVIVWEKDDNNPYLFCIDLSYTSTEPISVHYKKLPAGAMKPDAGRVLGPDDVSAVQDGFLRYTRKATDPLRITTQIVLPGYQAGWKAYSDFGGGGSAELPQVGQTADGQPVFEIETWTEDGDFVYESSLSLQWRDPNGIVRDAYHLSISLIQGEKKPWPEYAAADPNIQRPIYVVGSQKQFGENRFRVELINGFDGVSVSCDNGILLQEVDNEKLIEQESRLFEDAMVAVSVVPPAGAVCYAVRYTGGQVVFGPGQMYYSEPPADEREAISGDGLIEEWYPFFDWVSYNSGKNVYYRSSIDYPTDIGGYLPLYFWYDSFDATEPMLVEYYVRMAEPVELQSRTTILGDISDIPAGKEDKPFIVIAGFGDKGKNYTFHAQMYPTGENSRYYELQLLDHKGNAVPLPSLNASRYTVYIPHPKGVAADQTAFYIRHFDASGDVVKELYSFDSEDPMRRLYQAPNGKGIYFEVRSLSPFVLTWQEKEAAPAPTPVPAANPPKTGDRFPFGPLAAAALLSLMAAGWMMKSKRFE